MRYNAIYTKMVAIALLICTGLTSCTEEPLGDYNNSTQGKGVKVSFTLTVPDPQKVETRAAVDDALNSVFLLVFDTEDKYLEYAQANENSETKYNFIASLTERSTPCNIYIIANAPVIMSQVAPTWVAGTTMFDDVKSDLLKAKLVPSGKNYIPADQVPYIPPMISETPASVDKIEKSVTMDLISMVRVMAKVTVTVNESLNNVAVFGAALCNAPISGYIFPGMSLTGSDTGVADYYGESSGVYSLEYMTRTGSVSNPLYCYESVASNGTFVIVKASYNTIDGYYRINLKDGNGNPLALLRNHWYKVNINKVHTPGYRTAAEARANTALNDMPGSDVVIDVSDSYSHDIVSNGSQYLGVSNSNLIVYNSGALSNVLATRISYTVPSGNSWITGTIKAEGSGLSLAEANNNLTASDIAGRDIKVNMTKDFTSGKLTFLIGNLCKTVEIKKYGTLSPGEPPIFFEGYVTASKGTIQSNPSGDGDNYQPPGAGWARIASSDSYDPSTGGIPSDVQHVTSQKDTYLYFYENLGYSLSGNAFKTRNGEVFLAKSNEQGRAKVLFWQEGLDLYTNPVEIVPFTYVGTFHRSSETGERIIRIPVKSDYFPQGTLWRATVIVGQEWIRLSKNRSLDNGTGLNPYGTGDNPNWYTSNSIEAGCDQFLNKKAGVDPYTGNPVPSDWATSISGFPLTPAQVGGGSYGCVYFRVSLTSTIASTENRYGVIAITHNKGTHLIYVRQGENPDFLMKQDDRIEKGDYINGTRPLAAKFSPYNLAAPYGASSISGANNFYAPSDWNYTEVLYPSQGGYYFFPTSKISVSQKANVSYSTNTSMSNEIYLTNSNEPCPPGYRRPVDGSSTQWGVSSPLVSNSEIRQSFWLYPRNGSPTLTASTRDNIKKGYYADGYFDRREIQKTTKWNSSQSDAMTKGRSEVEDEYYNMAFAGYLLYNPIHYNSIFLPLSGFYTNSAPGPLAYGKTGSITNPGFTGIYQTKNFSSSNYVWTLQFGDVSQSDQSYADNYDHYNICPASVRCIKE